jgi:autophagy-related protein 13
MVIETYLDTSALTSSHSLVIVDDLGKRWDVLEALSNSMGSEGGSRARHRSTEVILERWKIELKDGEQTYDFASTLPTVYKKCIVFFRSLYSTSKFTPAWRFLKSMSKSGSMKGLLHIKCRIVSGDVQPGRFDALTHPLYEHGGPVTTDYFLGTTDTPVGQFSAEVSWRNDCNFRVDDSESLLSSRFMGVDEQYFQPSLGSRDSRHRTSKGGEVGSLPVNRHSSYDQDPIQAYGSLSTFHGDAPPRGSSPISALRAQKVEGSDTSSPPTPSAPKSRPIQTSRASLMSLEGITMARRPSVSFQPFKAGSLSSSPGRAASLPQGDMMPPQSPQSLPRGGISALTQARNRSSLTAGMPASLRGGPAVSDYVVPSSASSSPKPAPISRYSSSFTHRRGRSSYGGTSKIADDDQGSSGKQSLSSSVQPGSGILAEGAGGSSGSLQTDDDNIKDFLNLLDSKKTLQSFEPSSSVATKRTSAQLSKYQSMRESNNHLTESMSSSAMLHRSSTSSSRQLSSVPPMIAATSVSTSSSPGKPVSPHTPHTPAIPSRLSANSIAEYAEPRRRLSTRTRYTPQTNLDDVTDDDQTSPLGTNAIDIPTSPRPYYQHARRSSSVTQQQRAMPMDDDLGDLPFGAHRSISLGADDREPPSLSALLDLQRSENVASPSSVSPPHLLQPAPHISEAAARSRQPSPSLDGADAPTAPRGFGSTNLPYRPRIGRAGGRGVTPPQTGSYSSLNASGSGASERGSGRQSLTRPAGAFDLDDELLLFDMSEIGRDQSRRSIEDPRAMGPGNNERGVYDSGRGGDSGSSSRRGSRRGW